MPRRTWLARWEAIATDRTLILAFIALAAHKQSTYVAIMASTADVVNGWHCRQNPFKDLPWRTRRQWGRRRFPRSQPTDHLAMCEK
jgi:hypothetical protein